jgi:two-component system LytT family response regulator
MLKALIVENEVRAQKLLGALIADYVPDVQIIGFADNPVDAKKIVDTQSLDIVFLDIELNQGTGFDFLDSLENISFKIIFTTAYDHFALKAIKHGAVDYLLKPYSPKELIQAVYKVKESRQSASWLKEIQDIFMKGQKPTIPKLTVKTTSGLYVIDVDDIIRIEADSSYSKIYQSNGQTLMVSKPIGKLEEKLPKELFFRVHASHLINLQFVDSYRTEDGGYVQLKNKDKIPVARRKKTSFIEELTHFSG